MNCPRCGKLLHNPEYTCFYCGATLKETPEEKKARKEIERENRAREISEEEREKLHNNRERLYGKHWRSRDYDMYGTYGVPEIEEEERRWKKVRTIGIIIIILLWMASR